MQHLLECTLLRRSTTAHYMHTGDLFGQRPNTFKCVEHMGISSALIRRLANDKDGKVETTFRRWVVDRPRITDA